MALKQIDRDTVQPNGKRGAPGRTAMGIVNENAAETEQRLSAMEQTGPQLEQTLAEQGQRIDALDVKAGVLDGQVLSLGEEVDSALQSLLSEVSARQAGDAELRAAILQNLGRNNLINGNFDVFQEASSGTVHQQELYTMDQWTCAALGNGAICNWGVGGTPLGEIPGSRQFLGFNIVAGATAAWMGQKIERVETLSNGKATVSFWMRCGTAGRKVGVRLLQEFGTGGSPSASVQVASQQVFTLGASFQKFEYTFDVPSVAGKTRGNNGNDYLYLVFDLVGTGYDGQLVGQTGLFELAQVQFEEGDEATAFDRRHYAHEKFLCMLHYEVLPMFGVTGTTFTSNGDTRCARMFRVPKRAVPGLSYVGSLSVIGSGADGNIVNVIIDNITSMVADVNGVRISGIGNGPAMSGAGAVVTWADNGQNNMRIRANARL